TVVGDAYAVLGGVFAAAYFIIGRRVRPTMSWSRYVGTVYPTTALLLVAAALIAGDSFAGYSTKTYVMIVLLALGPQLIGHNAVNWSLAFVPAVLVGVAILGEPVGAAAWAALILDEPPTAFEFLGSPLVLLGIYLGLRPGPAQSGVVEQRTAEAGAEP
ncbi:MAG: DMT family transporter, partial [Dehalococcoidia bacterium]|nr:DMT family transporter [Dehalococcoidia bacterium]